MYNFHIRRGCHVRSNHCFPSFAMSQESLTARGIRALYLDVRASGCVGGSGNLACGRTIYRIRHDCGNVVVFILAGPGERHNLRKLRRHGTDRPPIPNAEEHVLCICTSEPITRDDLGLWIVPVWLVLEQGQRLGVCPGTVMGLGEAAPQWLGLPTPRLLPHAPLPWVTVA